MIYKDLMVAKSPSPALALPPAGAFARGSSSGGTSSSGGGNQSVIITTGSSNAPKDVPPSSNSGQITDAAESDDNDNDAKDDDDDDEEEEEDPTVVELERRIRDLGGTGIVYCRTKAVCNTVHNDLIDRGINAELYHGVRMHPLTNTHGFVYIVEGTAKNTVHARARVCAWRCVLCLCLCACACYSVRTASETMAIAIQSSFRGMLARTKNADKTSV